MATLLLEIVLCREGLRPLDETDYPGATTSERRCCRSVVADREAVHGVVPVYGYGVGEAGARPRHLDPLAVASFGDPSPAQLEGQRYMDDPEPAVAAVEP
jgi:hypothetical protein